MPGLPPAPLPLPRRPDLLLEQLRLPFELLDAVAEGLVLLLFGLAGEDPLDRPFGVALLAAFRLQTGPVLDGGDGGRVAQLAEAAVGGLAQGVGGVVEIALE